MESGEGVARLIKKARIRATTVIPVATKKASLIPSSIAFIAICCFISASAVADVFPATLFAASAAISAACVSRTI